MTFVFVYCKENKLKVLDTEAAKEQGQQLLLDGWKHTATLDPCKWIEHLFNDAYDLEGELKELSKNELHRPKQPTDYDALALESVALDVMPV